MVIHSKIKERQEICGNTPSFGRTQFLVDRYELQNSIHRNNLISTKPRPQIK
jgi:hypothetical protein